MRTCGTYNLAPGSVVNLLVLMYEIGENMKNMTFDLYWGYPVTGQDHLDGTAMAFSNNGTQEAFVDYSHRSSAGYFSHSGDLMDSVKQVGHHIIKVSLDQIPQSVTRVYFVLSAYNSPTIAAYPNPSVKLFEDSKPNHNLADYSITSVKQSQAVVMCCLMRGSKWRVVIVGRGCSGNAKNYAPIISEIHSSFNQFA